MANWFKEEIAQFGETVDISIQKASAEIQSHIDGVGAELNKQRTLTKSDVQDLIDYAGNRFGAVIDERVSKARAEIASLITEKVSELRLELTEAASEQKRTAIRNALIAISSAIVIGLLSLGYRKILHGDIDLLTVFRAVLAAAAFGHIVWIGQRYLSRYLSMNRTQKSVFLAGSQYLGAFRPKGAAGHLVVFILLVAAWIALNFWPQLREIFGSKI